MSSWIDFLKKGAAAAKLVVESVEQGQPDYRLNISIPIRARDEKVIKDIQQLQTQIEAFGPTIVHQLMSISAALSLAGEPSVKLDKVDNDEE